MRCWGPIWDPCASKQGICIKTELLRSAAKAVEQWLAMEPFACQMCWEPQVIVQAASVGETWMLSELLQGMVYLHKCALFEQTPNLSWMDHLGPKTCLLMILDATYYCQIMSLNWRSFVHDLQPQRFNAFQASLVVAHTPTSPSKKRWPPTFLNVKYPPRSDRLQYWIYWSWGSYMEGI